MNKFIWTIFYCLLLLIILSSCSLQSEDRVMKNVEETTRSTFKQDKLPTNQELKKMSIYIPENFEVIEEANSNVILEQENQTFILFYNPLEDSLSDLNFQAAANSDNHILLESFKDNKRFGYVSVMHAEEKQYELQVGIGGVKITTLTSKGDLVSDAETMMNIVNSVSFMK